MAPKHHPTPLSGGDRKALSKELGKSCAMASILAERAIEKRREGEALIGEADDLLCQSWNERPRWRDGSKAYPGDASLVQSRHAIRRNATRQAMSQASISRSTAFSASSSARPSVTTCESQS
jgi:hypothetical protein